MTSEAGNAGKESLPEIAVGDIGGYCPVQAEGTFDGVPFYFRARGERWTIGVGGDDIWLKPDWFYEEPYGDGPFAAGWMSISEAEGFIRKAARLWREARVAKEPESGKAPGQ